LLLFVGLDDDNNTICFLFLRQKLFRNGPEQQHLVQRMDDCNKKKINKKKKNKNNKDERRCTTYQRHPKIPYATTSSFFFNLTSITGRSVKGGNHRLGVLGISGTFLIKGNLADAQGSSVCRTRKENKKRRKEISLEPLFACKDISTYFFVPLVVAISTKFCPATQGRSAFFNTRLGAACNNKKFDRSATLPSKKSR